VHSSKKSESLEEYRDSRDLVSILSEEPSFFSFGLKMAYIINRL
jgi:hypothetical protein